ncbi:MULTISPECIES: glycosyltransferase family 2 protein [Spirulina sp. CCY15215]|uniref:glycosyltransferase family 2 protein n=1 Tax=Spirulina sp. CCY15215 TaxID=2767591 RepID=UPI00195061F5|nr:glycosyltransferase family 2 protein [Spirulina major]
MNILSPSTITYLPKNTSIAENILIPKSPFILPLLPPLEFPLETAKEKPLENIAWMGSREAIAPILSQLKTPESWHFLNAIALLEKNKIEFSWSTMALKVQPKLNYSPSSPKISKNSQILALIPHYNCHPWLYRCIKSLVDQTRPPDRIIILDDNSPDPPITITEKFPQVTLVRSSENVGPYRLIQQAIADTNYDTYLFQDADDWSANIRLEKLLETAEKTGAELIGTQEWRVDELESKLTPVCYPLDVNRALQEKPGHALMHPSSLVSRDLVMRVGGFATGLRFGGDTEFLLRAVFSAKIVNIPEFCYFRRKRPNSLTTALETGLDSPKRKTLLKALKARAKVNQREFQAGMQPDLTPLAIAQPIKLHYVSGYRNWTKLQ